MHAVSGRNGVTESGRGEIKYKGLLEIEKPQKVRVLKKRKLPIRFTCIITKLQHLPDDDNILIKTYQG
jgi:hypothetical protein